MCMCISIHFCSFHRHRHGVLAVDQDIPSSLGDLDKLLSLESRNRNCRRLKARQNCQTRHQGSVQLGRTASFPP
jgi:hypothetical protein